MLKAKRLPLGSLLAALVFTSGMWQAGEVRAQAAAEAKAEAQAGTEVTPEMMKRWAADLDSDNFDVRQDASRKLIAAGKAAIEVTAKAAEGDSLEATTRAIEILKKLHQSEDTATKDAAKAALENLTKSKNRSAARRATAALQPEPAANPNNNGGVLVPGGNIQIQLVPGQQVIRMQARAANGEKSVEVDENGKKIKVLENKDGITVTVTEKVDGKDKTSTWQAKNAEELKKNHPEGHKLYEKYAGNNGGGLIIGNIQIQAGAVPGVPLPIPALPLVPRVERVKPAGQKKAVEQLAEAQKRLQETADELKKLSSADNETLKKFADRIESARRQLSEAQQQLEE